MKKGLIFLLLTLTLLCGCAKKTVEVEKKPNPGQSGLTVTTVKGTEPGITGELKALLSLQYKQETKNITVTIAKADEQHVQGTYKYGETPNDQGKFLAAVNVDRWQLISSGQSNISCVNGKNFNFPADMITDCVK